jgi:proton-dependent oligopeptide transporter, POT family
LLLSQQQASFVYGLYTAFVYLTPIFGGMISDRWLGRRRSVVIGGSIMALGHFMMPFQPLFYAALAMIALGNGLYLPNLPSQIGTLYPQGDPRRTSSYSVYYVGINIGSFLAPLVCGTLGELYGWHWGFGAAGLGMVAGLLIYVSGGRYLPPEEPRTQPTNTSPMGWGRTDLAKRFILLGAIVGTVVIFRGAYEQLGNTVALWAEAGVDRRLGEAFVIPMTWFQSLNPMFVILLGPLLAARWTRLAQQGRDSTALTKMSLGAAGVGVAYLMLAFVSIWAHDAGQQASWLWLSMFCLVLTVGELYILPVGLALFGRLAPPRYLATTIATWFLAAFAGNLLAGAVGTMWSQLSHAMFFLVLAGVSILASAFLLLLRPALRRADAGAQPSTTPATGLRTLQGDNA